MDDHPEILEIIKEPGETYTFGAAWHTDQMFNPSPAKATMLYAKETPAVGGDTMFSSMYKAYDGLSDAMKAMLKDVKTFNVGDRFKNMGGGSRAERYAGNKSMAGKVRDPGNQITEAHHPLFRTHPETGRTAFILAATRKALKACGPRKPIRLLIISAAILSGQNIYAGSGGSRAPWRFGTIAASSIMRCRITMSVAACIGSRLRATFRTEIENARLAAAKRAFECLV